MSESDALTWVLAFVAALGWTLVILLYRRLDRMADTLDQLQRRLRGYAEVDRKLAKFRRLRWTPRGEVRYNPTDGDAA